MLISTILLAPIFTVLLVLLLDVKMAKSIALLGSVATFLLSLSLLFSFNYQTDIPQFVESKQWMENLNIYYKVGVDGISLSLILLTALLIPICLLISRKTITTKVKGFVSAFLLLETLVIGAFVALDSILFYVFFEATLIPMFFIIGIWGGAERIYASIKFFLYTLAGSLFLLVAIIYLYIQFGTTDMLELEKLGGELDMPIQQLLYLAMFASFAVKIPMWPFHTWLPDAHVQAPTAGSVILAGILLKLGGYGFIRFCLGIVPSASIYFADFMFYLSVIAIVYASLVALAQHDMKKMIAYSSIAHMGYVTIGVFSFNVEGMSGAMVQMISHGLVSAALFICVGILYDRHHTKEIAKYGGVTNIMPKFSMFFLFLVMASVGLPGTSAFIGEFSVLTGIYAINKNFAVIATSGIVLGAVYMLILYKRVMMGEVSDKKIASFSDINCCEKMALLPLVILILLIGIYPSCLTDTMEMSVGKYIKIIAEL